MTHPVSPAAQYCFGPFRLCLMRRSLWRGDNPVTLTPRALDLLAHLVRASGRVLTREELRLAVWGNTCVQDSNLTVHLCLLRRALAPEDYIATVPGQGYQFTAPVVTELGSARPETAIWLTCLPFRSGEKSCAEAAEGINLATVVALAKIPGLRLRPAGAAPVCGRDWTLEGCLQVRREQILVTAELVQPDGAVAWAEQQNFPPGDSERLQWDVAGWLQQALRENLPGGGRDLAAAR